jgi:hypothetical protein
MTRSLLVMADRLRELGVTRVVMEATSDYWKGVFYLLEAHGFETSVGLLLAWRWPADWRCSPPDGQTGAPESGTRPDPLTVTPLDGAAAPTGSPITLPAATASRESAAIPTDL